MAKTRGFSFDETMSGTYSRIDASDRHPLSFSIHAHAPSLLGYFRDRTVRIHGTLRAPGLADTVPIEGAMLLDPIGKRIIRYEFNFTGDDGLPYRFAGQKSLEFRNLKKTLTELPGAIYDAADEVVATSETYFDLRADWLRLLTSWRPTKQKR